MEAHVTTSLADGLRKLVVLREEGAITEAEFETAKAGLFVVPPDVFEKESRKLAGLLEEGALTEVEFEMAKAQTLVPPPEAVNVKAGGSDVYVIPPQVLTKIPISGSGGQRMRG